MQLAEERLNSAAFLCIEKKGSAGLEVVPQATVFFVADPTVERPHPVWAITGRHCIQEARALGGSMSIRVNAGDSFVDVPSHPDDWIESNNADVACCFWSSTEGDLVAIPITQLVSEDYTYRFGHLDLRNPNAHSEPIYIGAEMFFVGLFSQHAGKSRNLPVARFGNVSRLPGAELISVERKAGLERIDGYLCEARSWGGHSGSPAFWAHPLLQIIEVPRPVLGNRAQRRQTQRAAQQTVAVSREQEFVALLGLVSAHFDIPKEALTSGEVPGTVVTKLNSGMAVITPAHYIRELLDREDVREEAEEFRAKRDPVAAATMDILGFDDGAESEDMSGEEFDRFEGLAKRLMQVPKSEIDEKRKK